MVGVTVCMLLFAGGCLRAGTLSRFAMLKEGETAYAEGMATFGNGERQYFRAEERLETNGLTKLEIRLFPRSGVEDTAATLVLDDGWQKTNVPITLVTGEETYFYACLTDFPKTNFTLSYMISYDKNG